MKLFKMPTSIEDRFSRGFLRAGLVLGGVVLSGMSFGYAVEPFGWITGIVDPPAEVLVPARRDDFLVEYSAAVAWLLFLGGLFFGVLFGGGTIVAAVETVGIFRRAVWKARLVRQWKRHAKRNSGFERRSEIGPEPQNNPPAAPPGPGTWV